MQPHSHPSRLVQLASTACLLACCCCFGLVPAVAAQQHSQITTVNDLKAAIYTEMPFNQGADACVRLLNAGGTVGCAAPGHGPAEGRLQRLDVLLPTPEDYPGGSEGR